MRKLVFMAALLGGTALAMPAGAVLVSQGLTYTLTESVIDADTHAFVMSVTGINTASDTEGGRTGLNSVAFTQPANFANATMTNPAGFNLIVGGLNSQGCDGSGNFFCFDDPTITGGQPVPGPLLGPSFNIAFTVDTTGAFPANYNPSMKIDWVGSQNNYDLVSLPVGVTVNPPPPPPPPPPPLPEPGSLFLMASGLLGLAGFVGWRRRRDQE